MVRVVAITIVIGVLGLFYMSNQISADQESIKKPAEKEEIKEGGGMNEAPSVGDEADAADDDDEKTSSTRNG